MVEWLGKFFVHKCFDVLGHILYIHGAIVISLFCSHRLQTLCSHTRFWQFSATLWPCCGSYSQVSAGYVEMLVHGWCLTHFFSPPSGVTRMCAIRKARSWKAIMFLNHRGEIDPSKSRWCCLRGWRRACLLRERPPSGWRWSWRMERWILWHTE